MSDTELIVIAGVIVGALVMMLGEFEAYLAKLQAEGKTLPKFSLKYLISAIIACIMAAVAIMAEIVALPEPTGIDGWLGLFLFGFMGGMGIDFVFNKPMDWYAKYKAAHPTP